MFAHEFVRNAWLAGTFVALACGTIGWFTVMRAQVFAGDALSHVAFVGAIAAATLGIDERIGLFALTLLLAGAMGALGRRAQADDVTIGTTFAWVLGIGVLLLAVLATSPGGAAGVTTANALFGSIYSLSAGGGGARRGDRAGLDGGRSCSSPGRCCWPPSIPSWRAAGPAGAGARAGLPGGAGAGHRPGHPGRGGAAAARPDRGARRERRAP